VQCLRIGNTSTSYVRYTQRQRPIGCLILRFPFRKLATNYWAHVYKKTCKDEESYRSRPPCSSCGSALQHIAILQWFALFCSVPSYGSGPPYSSFCSALQYVAVCCSAPSYGSWTPYGCCCSVLQCVAVRCCVLKYIATCRKVLHCVAVCHPTGLVPCVSASSVYYAWIK